MHCIGSNILEKLLNSDGGDYKGRSLPCDKGDVFEFIEYRDKKLLTVLGLVEEFAHRIYAEAICRGIERAEKVCIIGDGAPWIWNIADEQF